MERYPLPDLALTHAGVFHADDVFSAALLHILNPSIVIERAYSVTQDYVGIAFDIGGGEFDHHGANRLVRKDDTPYAAFGLLWKAFGTLILHPDDALEFDADFVKPIDLADNCGGRHGISQLVSDFNPEPPASAEEYDAAFSKAVAWAEGVLSRRFASIKSARNDYNYIQERMETGGGQVLVLERCANWQRAVVNSGYAYVVYPSVRGGFNVQGVPSKPGCNHVVVPFPKEWRGQNAAALGVMTGIEGFEFCHPSGHLCSSASLEGALRVAYKSLEMERR